MTPKELLTESYLRCYYVEAKKSEAAIAAELGLKSSNSVRYYIKKFGLARERLRPASGRLTKEYLEEHYVRLQKGMRTIAAELGIKGRLTIRRALSRAGIPVRSTWVDNQARQRANVERRTGHGGISGRYWSSVAASAALREIPFGLTAEQAWAIFLAQGEKCAYTGLSLRFYNPGEKPTSQTASLDRIDSSLGYSVGNVHWVHKDVQRMKSSLGEGRFLELCRLAAHHRPG